MVRAQGFLTYRQRPPVKRNGSGEVFFIYMQRRQAVYQTGRRRMIRSERLIRGLQRLLDKRGGSVDVARGAIQVS